MVLSRFLGLALSAVVVTAQPLQVLLQLPFADNMPARIEEWLQNEQLIRIVVQNTDRRSGYEELILSVRIEREGKLIVRSKDGHPAQPRWALGPGQTRAFSWREVVSLEALEYDQSLAQQTLATGELPEGRYQLCLTVFRLPLMQPMSVQVCGNFAIRPCCPQPIALLNPPNGATVAAPPLLQWTPCAPPTAAPFFYRLTVAPRWFGQSPADAISQNPPRIQQIVSVPQHQVTPAEWSQLLADAAVTGDYISHVWQVQPLRQLPGGFVPCGKPSPIAEFRVRKKIDLPIEPSSWGLAQARIRYEDLQETDTVRVVCDLPPGQMPPDTLLVRLEVAFPDTLVLPSGPLALTDPYGAVVRGRFKADSVWLPVPVLGALSARMLADTGVPLQRYVYNGYYLYGTRPEDTLSVYGRFIGGYYLYGTRPEDTLSVYGQFAGGYYLYGTHPGDTSGEVGTQAKYTGYVLNQAIASGAGRASGRTFSGVTKAAPPRGPKPRDVGLPDYRQASESGGSLTVLAEFSRQKAYNADKDYHLHMRQAQERKWEFVQSNTGGVVVCWPQGRPGDNRPVAVYEWLVVRNSKPLSTLVKRYGAELQIVKMIVDRPDGVDH